MKLIFTLIGMLITLPIFADSEWSQSLSNSEKLDIEVYRSPDCSCCHRWIEHLELHGFNVTDHLTPQMTSVKEKLGLPTALASCHTAVINGYLIEGHVPATDIIRLVTERSELKGLSVPLMPVGTPGMEMGDRKDNFAVIGFDKDNKFSIYTRYQVGSDQRYRATLSQD